MGNACSNSSDIIKQEFMPTKEELLPLSPERNQNKKKERVRILSYNIFIRPPPVRSFNDDYKSERLKEFTKQLDKYDIICLQELFLLYSSRRENFINAAKEAGFAYFKESPRPDVLSTLLCDGGLVTLSRFPILYSEFKAYPRGIGTDYIVEKGVLYTRIQVKDSSIHLFSTHTQACYSSEIKYFTKLMDQWQCFREFMIEMLRKHYYRKQDTVLAVGDFNVDGRNPFKHKTKNLARVYPAIKKYANLLKQESIHEYDALVSILSDDNKDEIEELLLNQHKEHPTTFGDFFIDEKNKIKPREQDLTYTGGQASSRRLDYIFKVVPKSLGNGTVPHSLMSEIGQEPKLKVKEGSAKVRQFLITGREFTQLSDHYGVKVTLELNEKGSRYNSSGSTLSESPTSEECEKD